MNCVLLLNLYEIFHSFFFKYLRANIPTS